MILLLLLAALVMPGCIQHHYWGQVIVEAPKSPPQAPPPSPQRYTITPNSSKQPPIYQCAICGETFYYSERKTVCAVNHGVGECCHLGEERVTK